MAKKNRYYQSDAMTQQGGMKSGKKDMIGNAPSSWDEMPQEVIMRNYPSNAYMPDDMYPDTRGDIDENINATERGVRKQRNRDKY